MAVLLAGAVLMVLLGRRQRGTGAAGAFRRLFAIVIMVFHVPLLVYNLLPSQWDIHTSLPFHLSDLSWMVAGYALWTRRPWAYALTYYWGLTLTPQAMFTPALDAPGFPHVDFVEFWGQHLLVVWATVYLTWGLGMRPNWRSYTIAVSVTVTWAAVMLMFNESIGTNYGFLNSKPSNPSLLDVMGGWPWYLLVEFLVVLTAWALITWPWTRVRGQR